MYKSAYLIGVVTLDWYGEIPSVEEYQRSIKLFHAHCIFIHRSSLSPYWIIPSLIILNIGYYQEQGLIVHVVNP